MPRAELRSVLKPLRRGFVVVLIVLLFSVTAYILLAVTPNIRFWKRGSL